MTTRSENCNETRDDPDHHELTVGSGSITTAASTTGGGSGWEGEAVGDLEYAGLRVHAQQLAGHQRGQRLTAMLDHLEQSLVGGGGRCVRARHRVAVHCMVDDGMDDGW